MPLPPVYRRMAYAQNSADGTIVLLTINHPDLAEPLYFAGNPVGVSSNGQSYEPAGFEFVRPQPLAGNSFTPATLRIPVVDQQMILMLRSVVTEADVFAQEVMISDRDTVVASYTFKMSGEHTYDAQWLNIPLIFEQVLEEAIPYKMMSPTRAPGLFSGD